MKMFNRVRSSAVCYGLKRFLEEPPLFTGVITGLLLSFILPRIGMTTGPEGVLYYAEVHKSVWNRVIHTFFMPITTTGFMIAIPAALHLHGGYAVRLLDFLYFVYTAHYTTFDLIGAAKFMIVYFFVVMYASKSCYSFNRTQRLRDGLSIGIGALIIQEVVGHYIGGDERSRMEAIPNAILYAPFFSVAHTSY